MAPASVRDVTGVIDDAEDAVVRLASTGSSAQGAVALIRLKMLRSVAWLHGAQPDDDFLVSLGDTLSQGLAARTLTESMARWVPVLGRLVDALSAARMTHELGWAAHEHFAAMEPRTLAALAPARSRPIAPDSVPPAMLADGSPNPLLVTGHQGPTWVGIDELERRVAANPQDDDLLALLGFVYYTAAQYAKAIDIYRRAIALDDASPQHHYYLANALFRAGQFAPAHTEWERVTELDPDGRLGRNAKRRASSVKTIKV